MNQVKVTKLFISKNLERFAESLRRICAERSPSVPFRQDYCFLVISLFSI